MIEQDDSEFAVWLEETYRLRGITDAIPPRLYKFLSSESKYFRLAMHELFLHNRIYMSCRKDFNDPLDTSFGIDVPDNEDAIAEFVSGIVSRTKELNLPKQHLEALTKDPKAFGDKTRQNLSESLDKMGIFSLSQKVSNPLMWAHYACSHRGVALIFRHAAVEGGINAFPIRSQAEYPRTVATAKGLEVYFVLTKGLAWEYEAEWRLVESKMARQWKEVPPTALVGIVFGALASRDTHDFVLDLLVRRVASKLPPLLVCRAEIGESFDLSFVKYVGTETWEPIVLSEGT